MKQNVRLTLKRALQTYLVILPFAVIGGITVGMYTFEHSTPQVIEAAIAQLGSYQALIAVTMIQTLVYSLIGWVVGYFIASLLYTEWFICSVLWKMVSQVWHSVCNVRAFRNSFSI